MTVDGDETVEGGDSSQPPVNTTAAKTEIPIPRLSLFPNNEHIPDKYDDPRLEFSSLVLRSLEKYLPMDMLTERRYEKAKFMSDILRKYISRKDCSKVNDDKIYRQKIISSYQPRLRELYELDPESFLFPSFRKAVNENTEESFRRIISQPFPGVFVFQMFQPDFSEKLLVEVENFRDWVNETKFKIRRPNNKSKHGFVLNDFGLDIMLTTLMEEFIFPICKGKSIVWSNHEGFVVKYGQNGIVVDSDFYVEDSDITLNVCLSKQFEGGGVYFAGIRCEQHVNTDAKLEEAFDYCQLPGQAILHSGRHRHGVRATTSGYWANMIFWCKSSLYREMQTYEKEFPDWCYQCNHEKKENESQILAAKRKV